MFKVHLCGPLYLCWPLVLHGPFTCMGPLRFRVALLHLYRGFHYNMGPFHPREATTPGSGGTGDVGAPTPNWLNISAKPKLRFKLDAQLSQRDGAAGCVIVLAKSGRMELGDNIVRTL